MLTRVNTAVLVAGGPDFFGEIQATYEKDENMVRSGKFHGKTRGKQRHRGRRHLAARGVVHTAAAFAAVGMEFALT
jgi:hypothetical protein